MQRIVGIVFLVVADIFPFPVMSVFYSVSALRLWWVKPPSSDGTIVTEREIRTAKRNKKVILMLAVITSANLACLVPLGIVQLFMYFVETDLITFICERLFLLLYISEPFATLVIYYYMSSDFKKRLREIVHCHNIVHGEDEQNTQNEMQMGNI